MGNLTSTLTLKLIDDGLEAKAPRDAENRTSAPLASARARSRSSFARSGNAAMMSRLLPDDEDIPMRPDADGNYRVTLHPEPPRTGPQPRPKSSRTIAREKAKAAEAERIAAEAAKLRGMVHRSLKPLPGRLWSLHGDALLLIGPCGAIAVPASAVPVLEPLVASGRHVLEERALAALDALAPRLAVVGLRVDRHREGVRIAKVRTSAARAAA